MRVRVLVEGFSEGDPVSWVQALAAIVTRVHQVDDPDATLALESITHAAADPALPYATRKQLYEAAAARGLPAIARLFLSASPMFAQRAELDKQLAPERPLKPTSRPLTLGERKALARTHSREQLLLLVRDPHPEVVGILLENPHVTETEIVRIAASRPAVPDSLAKIAAHARWSLRPAVKRALVLNPNTPLADAIRIATTLGTHELQQLAADPALPEALRRHATELYETSSRRPRA
jgi:hypothetical protein